MLPNIASTTEESVRFPRQTTLLHILHSWGGGVARWTEDFIHHATEQRHLILHSRGDRNVFGRELALVEPARPESPLALWELTPPISATNLTHPLYAAVLNDLLTGFSIEKVVASSLIGHSLEVLRTGLPTLRVLHDLYPYCPAMFGYFGASCEQCEPDKLTACLRTNPYNECWHNSVPEDWVALRQAYANALLKPQVHLIAPTRTIRDRLYRLYPEIAGKTCHIIAHGVDLAQIGSTTAPPFAAKQLTNPSSRLLGLPSPSGKSRKLRIIVPGRLEPHKGLQLLQEALPQLLSQAEFFLLGCGLLGQPLASLHSVTVVPDYSAPDLGPLTRDFAPDCALFFSILPETFSYTLSEMMALGIPPLATNLGAFAERLHHGKNGFLYEPNLQSLIALVTSLAKDRSPLITIAQHLRSCPIRQARDMVQDYQALPPVTPARTMAAKTKGWLVLGMEKAQAQLYGKTASLEQEILHQARKLKESHQKMTVLHQTLAHSRTRATALEQELNALRHSNSWRLTAPLRIFIMALRAWCTQLRSTLLISVDSDPSLLAAGEKSKKEAPPQSQIWNTLPLSTPPAPSPGNALLLISHSQDTATQTLRVHLREQLAIPDVARIVLSITYENRPEAVQAFIQAAATLANCRREVYFLWLEGEHAPPLSPQQKAWGLAIAPRRLFFEKVTDATLPTYLTASDLLYLPDGEGQKLPLPTAITALEAFLINNSTDDDLTTLIIKALQNS